MVFLGAFSPDPSEPRAELVPPVLTSSSPSPSSSPFFCCLFVGLLVCCCCCCCCFVFCLECLFMLVRLCSIYMCFVRVCVFVCSSVRFLLLFFSGSFGDSRWRSPWRNPWPSLWAPHHPGASHTASTGIRRGLLKTAGSSLGRCARCMTERSFQRWALWGI